MNEKQKLIFDRLNASLKRNMVVAWLCMEQRLGPLKENAVNRYSKKLVFVGEDKLKKIKLLKCIKNRKANWLILNTVNIKYY